MSGGKSSQRKGRTEELEVPKEAIEFGLTASPHKIYETLDVTIEGDQYEVKRCERLSIKLAYDALNAGARGLISKCNRKPRLITIEFRDWLEDQRELKELRAKVGTPVTITEQGIAAIAELGSAEGQGDADITTPREASEAGNETAPPSRHAALSGETQ